MGIYNTGAHFDVFKLSSSFLKRSEHVPVPSCCFSHNNGPSTTAMGGLFTTRRVLCEQSKNYFSDSEPDTQASRNGNRINGSGTDNDEKANIRAATTSERLRAEQENESCPSCLYVGVATSVGLSVYFARLAMEKVDERTLSASARQHQRYNKPVFLAFSVGWLAIGVYRWHLG